MRLFRTPSWGTSRGTYVLTGVHEEQVRKQGGSTSCSFSFLSPRFSTKVVLGRYYAYASSRHGVSQRSTCYVEDGW